MRIQALMAMGLVIFLAACGSISGRNQIETLAAENRSHVTEAVQIRGTISAQQTEVLTTAVAAETFVARENAVNGVILETVRAGIPPTVGVSARIDRSVGEGGATPDPSLFSGSEGGVVAETYVTTAVRDSDGCGVDNLTQFPSDTTRMFAVQRYQTISANTLVSVTFTFGGATALEDNLVVTTDETDFCVWFFLEPYSQGSWSAQFYANGNPAGQQVTFNVGG